MMKKLFGFFILTLFIAGTAVAQISQGGTAWVSAKTVTLKSGTGFFAGKRGTASYGDQVSILRVSGKWAEVRTGTISGWMASANLSAKRILSSSGGSSASASEVALAGKGFSQEVENVYKAEGNLNYADVDKTEAIVVTEDELLRFVTEGHLAQGE